MFSIVLGKWKVKKFRRLLELFEEGNCKYKQWEGELVEEQRRGGIKMRIITTIRSSFNRVNDHKAVKRLTQSKRTMPITFEKFSEIRVTIL